MYSIDHLGSNLDLRGLVASIDEALTTALEMHQSGDLQAAERIYHQILNADPCNADALHLLGVVSHQTGKPHAAVDLIRRAIALNSATASFHCNLGGALRAIQCFDDAVQSYLRALQIQPDYLEAFYNLGNVLRDLGQLDEAAFNYRRALNINPDCAEAHFNLGLVHLAQGQFEAGWEEYEWRFRQGDAKPRPFRQPQWNGEELNGRTILVHAEQGLGDTLQFVRYLPFVQQRGGTVIFECQTPLVRLLRDVAGFDQMIPQGDSLPAFDLHIPLLSLPRIFGTTISTVPSEVPYLNTDAELVRSWTQRLDNDSGIRIGICWQGDSTHPRDGFRSIPVNHFTSLTRFENVTLVSLQKGPGAEQLKTYDGSARIIDFSDELDEQSGPFVDTAAIMSLLDLVITSDTAIVHLAGALGIPVWMAIDYSPDWRWLRERQDSPWYPSLRMFRQSEYGDWQGVFHRITNALQERFGIDELQSDDPTPTEPPTTKIKPSQKKQTPVTEHGEIDDQRQQNELNLTAGAISGEMLHKPFNRLKNCRYGPMLYNIHDTFIGRSLDIYGEFSEGEIELFRQVAKPGDVVLDVGANIGAHTVFFAKAVGSSGAVLAFEPQRIVYQTLCANMALNSLTNVVCRQCAVGEAAGEIVVPALDYHRDSNFGGLGLGGYTSGENVSVVTIDSLDLQRCKFIKIDVEGMEKSVLEGAVNTVARLRPILYVENDRKEKSAELIRYIDSLGYLMYWHLPLLYNPRNYFGNSDNVFPNIVSHNMLCCHRSVSHNFIGLEPVEIPPVDRSDPNTGIDQ